jgi:pilus assembly protein CpaB
MRALLILFMVAGIGGLGVLGFVALRPAPAPRVAEVEPVRKVAILVAARPLRGGTLLKPEDMASAEVDEPALPAGALRDTREARQALLGAMIRRAANTRDPLSEEDLLRPGEHGFLAAVLGPDMRAVSIGVDMVSGIAGLVFPGDRVDLLLTQSLDDRDAPPSRRIAGETVLTDVRVIAIDQNLTQGGAGDPSGAARQTRTVTVEVTARQAERIAVATRLGRLSLVVRSASRGIVTAEAEEADAAPSITWGGDVSPALRGNQAQPGTVQTIRVIRGNQRTDEYRF